MRLSYSDASKNNAIESNEIIEETNYYPFGLAHKGYNQKNDGLMKDYRYRYQEQERQSELDLNWDSFKWRNYDYTIGRFMNIDPLSEKYPYQSHYNFSENRVIDGRELEGLEWENFRTTGKKPKDLKMKLPSSNAQKQHYIVDVIDSERSFSDLKSSFQNSPQKLLTNSKATFNSPVDGEGEKAKFEVGNYIKIDIVGPMNNAYVKIVNTEDKENYASATFVTMEGHIEKGKITFRMYENKDGSIRFTINSLSEVDMGLAPEAKSRKEQAKSWNEVLTNIVNYLDGEEKNRESKVINQ